MGTQIDQVRFHPALPGDRRLGLYGWASCQVADWFVGGLAVRRTQAGDVRVSFPQRRDKRGRAHPLVHPLNSSLRREIEAQVIARLREMGYVA